MMQLWVEQYRPKSLDEYVWRDADQRAQVEKWIAQGALPNLMLVGRPGVGKTSMARMLLKELKVHNGDIMEINASRERNPDVIADKILSFCTTWAFGDMKYIILDESDRLTPLAQGILRNLTEQYHQSVRFIFTANEGNRIIPALHSRCQGFDFQALDLDEFRARIANILINEGVKLETEDDIAVMDEYVELTYPDLRKCINLLQQSVNGDQLTKPKKADSGVKDYLLDMVSLFKNGQYTEARKLVVSQAQPEEYTDIYRFMYQNLNLWGEDDDKQNQALLVIADYLAKHALVADAEINLAACMARLSALAKE